MRTSAISSFVFVMLFAALFGGPSIADGAQSQPQPDENRPVPVFRTAEVMAELFEPLYGELTRAIATEPADRAKWQSALTIVTKLAELQNLLFFRNRESYTQRPEWPQQVAAMRARLLSLAEAVRARDYALTRKQYEAAVIGGCNSCHKESSTVPVLLKPYDPEIER